MSVKRIASAAALAFALAASLCACAIGAPPTPLGRAAASGDLPAMTALLDGGADPNGTGAHGLTPLAVAARSGRLDAIDLLVARGADPHRGCGVNGWTPLQHALHKNQLVAADRLIALAPSPSAELDDALFMAAGYAETHAVIALLARGANPAKDFGHGANALSNAVAGAFDIDFSYGGCDAHTETVRALLASPASRLTGAAGDAARRSAERHGCAAMLALLR
jgi:hypothetical protein